MPAKLLVTGASGQLGGLVLAALTKRHAPGEIGALVRKEADRDRLVAQGFDVRLGDYTDKAGLVAAFEGVERLLLISSSEVGQRLAQHENAIAAAREAGVGFLAYTSLLAADRSPMVLAEEHRATEALIAASGLAHTLLRNGWYSENITASLAQDLALGQHFGAAGDGRFATAPRADYAEAAALVLSDPGHDGQSYALAGDQGYTLAEYAAEVSAIAGQPVAYVDMPAPAFEEALVGAGLPGPLAAILADSDAKARDGWLDSDSRDLSRLIGRATVPIGDTIRAALAAG